MSEEEVVKLVFPESKREEDKEVKALLQPTGYEKKNRIFDVEEIPKTFNSSFSFIGSLDLTFPLMKSVIPS